MSFFQTKSMQNYVIQNVFFLMLLSRSFRYWSIIISQYWFLAVEQFKLTVKKPKPNQLLTVTNETTQPIPNYNKTKPIKVIVWWSWLHGTFDAQLKNSSMQSQSTVACFCKKTPHFSCTLFICFLEYWQSL